MDLNVSQLSELVESYLQFCYVNQRNFVFLIFFLDHMNFERLIKIFVVLSEWGNTKNKDAKFEIFFSLHRSINRNVFLEFS